MKPNPPAPALFRLLLRLVAAVADIKRFYAPINMVSATRFYNGSWFWEPELFEGLEELVYLIFPPGKVEIEVENYVAKLDDGLLASRGCVPMYSLRTEKHVNIVESR
jgi:hypothetical protein